MDYYRYYPMLGVNFKLFHVVDSFSHAVTEWDPSWGLAAKDKYRVPSNEKKFHKSITDHFHGSINKSIYIPVVQRQHLKVEELKKRVQEKAEKILVLEIDVEKIMPKAKIFSVHDIIAGREGPWVGDPREDEWKVTYLILHWVPLGAVTAYEPEAFLKKGEFCLFSDSMGLLSSVQNVKKSTGSMRPYTMKSPGT